MTARHFLRVGLLWALVVTVAAGSGVACEPAARTSEPSERPATEPADTVPEPKLDRARLQTAIESAEQFARLEAAFSAVRRIEEGRLRVLEDVGARWPAGSFTIELIGVRSGFPAFAVSRTASSERHVFITPDEELLVPPNGFLRFVQLAPSREAAAWASAWLVLVAGLAREPLGPWSDPSAVAPRWRSRSLTFSYLGTNGEVQEMTLTFDAEDVPRIVQAPP